MILYKISNSKNEKLYFGITSKALRVRWAQHKYEARNGSNYAIHRAMRKHGVSNFHIEEVSAHMTFDDAKMAETKAISDHGTMANGYNMTIGGDGFMGGKHMEETRIKIRAAHAGKTLSQDHKDALYAANKGRKMSDSHKEALRSRIVSDEERQARRDRAIGNKWAVGCVRTAEQKKALSDAAASRVMSEEAKGKIRAARAEQGPTYGMLGKTHSDETKAKMRAAKLGIKKSPETIERMREAARKRVEAKRVRETDR